MTSTPPRPRRRAGCPPGAPRRRRQTGPCLRRPAATTPSLARRLLPRSRRCWAARPERPPRAGTRAATPGRAPAARERWPQAAAPGREPVRQSHKRARGRQRRQPPGAAGARARQAGQRARRRRAPAAAQWRPGGATCRQEGDRWSRSVLQCRHGRRVLPLQYRASRAVAPTPLLPACTSCRAPDSRQRRQQLAQQGPHHAGPCLLLDPPKLAPRQVACGGDGSSRLSELLGGCGWPSVPFKTPPVPVNRPPHPPCHPPGRTVTSRVGSSRLPACSPASWISGHAWPPCSASIGALIITAPLHLCDDLARGETLPGVPSRGGWTAAGSLSRRASLCLGPARPDARPFCRLSHRVGRSLEHRSGCAGATKPASSHSKHRAQSTMRHGSNHDRSANSTDDDRTRCSQGRGHPATGHFCCIL